MNYREKISENIRKYRKMSGISQTELANYLGVSKAAVSNWEKGINGVDTDTLFKIADILHVSVSALGGIQTDYSITDPDTKAILETVEYMTPENKKDLLLYAKFIQEKRLVEYAKLLGQLREESAKKGDNDETN